MPDDLAQVSIRIPTVLAEHLRKVAEERMVHQSLIVAKALEVFLDGLGPPLTEPIPMPDGAAS